jgi:hypothetical protein
MNKMRIYLKVPFGEHHHAKARGAHWDRVRRSWFVISTQAFNSCRQWALPLSAEEKAWLNDPQRLSHYEESPLMRL